MLVDDGRAAGAASRMVRNRASLTRATPRRCFRSVMSVTMPMPYEGFPASSLTSDTASSPQISRPSFRK